MSPVPIGSIIAARPSFKSAIFLHCVVRLPFSNGKQGYTTGLLLTVLDNPPPFEQDHELHG